MLFPRRAKELVMTEWFLYVRQSLLDLGDLLVRAQAPEASGFDGVAFLDHLETPMAPDSLIRAR
jgi:hypothetical protein